MKSSPTYIFDYTLEEDSLSFLRYIGIALVLVSLMIMKESLIGGGLMAASFLAMTLLVKKTRIRLNLKEKVIETKKGFLVGNRKTFDEIEYFRFNSKKISQQFNSRGTSSVIKYTLYQGYAKVSGNLILIAEGRDKEKLYSTLLAPANILGVDVIDNS